MHVNIKPFDPCQIYETDAQAIAHIFRHGPYPKDWAGVHFGRDMQTIRRLNDAIKAKDASAFVAMRRKGFWRVEPA